MAPRELVPWTIDEKLLNSADQARSMEIGLGVVASFVFIVALAVVTLVNCACCKGSKTEEQHNAQAENFGRPTPIGSPAASSKIESGKGLPSVSFDSSAAVGLTTAPRDLSKPHVSLRQIMQQKGAGSACNTPCVGLPVSAKTPTSSQQAPPQTLHAAPAFTDFVNESKK